MPQSESGSSQSKETSSYSGSPGDDWNAVTDPNERRKIQNRIAQRKFRESAATLHVRRKRQLTLLSGDKTRQQREADERKAIDQQRAGGSYSTARPEDLDKSNEEGLPWGSISMRHIVESGRSREKSSRESSVYAAASRTGGSSR